MIKRFNRIFEITRELGAIKSHFAHNSDISLRNLRQAIQCLEYFYSETADSDEFRKAIEDDEDGY